MMNKITDFDMDEVVAPFIVFKKKAKLEKIRFDQYRHDVHVSL
jgi:hypothetical protein